jgi:hypothetical protein
MATLKKYTLASRSWQRLNQSLQESIFSATQEKLFSSPLFLIFFSHAQTSTQTGQLNILPYNYSTTLTEDRRAADNSSLAKWRVMCFYDSLVINQSEVLQLNFCAKNPPLRQAAKRYATYFKKNP